MPAGAPLSGRTALVTGASRGIGRAVSRALASAGARLFLLARSRDALESLAFELGGGAEAYACDLADAPALSQTVSGVLAAAGGQVDILVSNAGIFPLAAIADTSPSTFEQTLTANLTAPYRLLHALLPGMRAQRSGHVVTIGSVADRRIFGGNGAYSASKFGARALHEVLREECVGSGIRTTLVSPAATDTPIWDPVDPDNTPGFPPRASMLLAADVADAVLWAVTRPPHVNVDELRISRA
ncbi:SDR family oxidoreductase [Gemmatimonas sp.]|jgi:NADP-dependent 3-hydroxy acid dehydrogenase YdfG|uniref:SDR family oxidoreductase n=1 Tax=Gemmatimonas sp. TaxID=1962908 RepID=UPI0022C7586F|nr:SDR family oxidoreductase [Gemmatimonas sp.]MCZ8205900.1 SDR family oxidoreductase [Gemmatimonas sp.]